MRKIQLTPAILLLALTPVLSQTVLPPCAIQATMQMSICIDPPGCIIFTPQLTGGTGPYTYNWSTGTTNTQLYFGGSDPAAFDCHYATITDAYGCVVVVSTFGNSAATLNGFLKPDTLIGTGVAFSFDIGQNDHALAQQYKIVQLPAHGTLTLNADGTGQYTRDANWCGPDYFRYTASDTTQCTLAKAATVDILNAPCAAILAKSVDCKSACTGSAVFYEQGMLAHPLGYLWSNGSSSATAEQLCSGPVSLTVTDANGDTHVFTGNIPASGLTSEIIGPDVICNNDLVLFQPLLSDTTAGATYFYEWSGQGIYTSNQFNFKPVVNFYASSGAPVNFDTSYTYRLIVRSSGGCVDSSFHTMTLHPRPVAKMLSFNYPICPGDTLVMPSEVSKGVPPYSYYWTGPLGVISNYSSLVWPGISGAGDGFYYLTVTDANGCRASDIKYVTVPDSCAFSIIFYNPSNIYCKGSDIPIQYGISGINSYPSTPPDKYEWTGPNGFQSNEAQVVLEDAQPSMAGVYTLTVRFGPNIYTGQTTINISDQAASVTDLAYSPPPSTCNYPGDGAINVTMSTPPPYTVSNDWGGFASNTNSNPFKVDKVRPGNIYSLTVATGGCKVIYKMDIPYPAEPQFVATDESCTGGDGAIEITSANPLQISWDGPNNFSAGDVPAISGLAAGVYRASVKDLTTKCLFNQDITIQPYLRFEAAVLDTPTCIDQSGALEILTLGQAAQPVTYFWNTGFNGNPSANLAWGWYSLTMTDADGCNTHQNVFLPAEETCIALLSGRVYVNPDCICTADTNDYPYVAMRVCATNGATTDCAYTDNTGAYQLAVTEAGTYTVTAYPFNSYFANACNTQTVTITDVSDKISGLDLFFCAPAVTDVAVTAGCSGARPGFEHYVYLSVKNRGTIQVDTSYLTAHIDQNVDIQQISPAPVSFDPQSQQITWLVRNLPVNGEFKALVGTTVTAALGDTLHHWAEVAPKTMDVEPSDNISFCERLVTGSYDPNDKTVNPIGAGSGGGIAPSDSLLTYTIRFQNTGTDTAFTVIVRDTLDAAVYDLSSVRPLLSTHPYRLDVEGEHILVFYFENILLPDSNRSVIGSQGFVMFSIALKKDLPDGTVVKNAAAIYFDYNLPVITNTAINTITAATSPQAEKPGLSIFPNPLKDKATASIYLPSGTQWLRLEMVGLDGRSHHTVMQTSAPPQGAFWLPLDLGGLPVGLYMARLQTNHGIAVSKVVKME